MDNSNQPKLPALMHGSDWILSLVLVYVAVGLLTLIIGIVETVIFYQNNYNEFWPIWYFNLGGFRTMLKLTNYVQILPGLCMSSAYPLIKLIA